MKLPFPIRLLRSFCPSHLLEEIEGDLYQTYERDSEHLGHKAAARRMYWNTIRYFRPGIILRNKRPKFFTHHSMLTNYLTVALRVMMRSKSYSFINIAGLAMGMTSALLLSLWIFHEFSYENFHSDKDRIFKAWNKATENGKISCWDVTPRVLAPTLSSNYSSIEDAVSYADWGMEHLFLVGDKKIMNTSGAFTDPAFLKMFSFPLQKGNVNTALKESNSIVITEKFARQLFGDAEAFGASLSISESGQKIPLVVTGVLKDLPQNTDFHFDYLLPFHLLEGLGGKDTQWGNNSVSTYVKVRTGTDVMRLGEEIKGIVKKNYADGQHIEIFLHPLTKMRLYSRFENGKEAGGRIEIIRMLGILAVCLVTIACINFINLSTARAQRRAKEVAVRKVTGALRTSVVFQFLCESILIALSAGIISLLVAKLLLPPFNLLVHHQLDIPFSSPIFWLIGILFILLVGTIAGSYPAFFLSGFRPAAILKGGQVTSSRNTFRSILVVLQFGFAVTLITSAIVVSKQITFIQNRDSGYNKNGLVFHSISGDLSKNYNSYRNELLESNVAIAMTKTSSAITNRWSNTNHIGWEGKDPQDRTLFERFYVDENMSSTAGFEIIKGRDMDLKQYPADSTAALINETAANAMGFTYPIGQIIKDNGQDWHIIGVIKDFILTSPHQKVEPIILFGGKAEWALSVVHIRLNPQIPVQQSIDKMGELFKKYNPEFPFEYYFADAAFAAKFSNIKTTLTITTLFTSIAIFIACLGLLGLAAFMTESRVKEIGIRKVLGGTVIGITKLLSIKMLKPIFIAILVFSPLAWFAMDWWLQSFYYRISMDITVPLFTAISILAIGLLTIIVQTILAARANPADSLRIEQ